MYITIYHVSADIDTQGPMPCGLRSPLPFSSSLTLDQFSLSRGVPLHAGVAVPMQLNRDNTYTTQRYLCTYESSEPRLSVLDLATPQGGLSVINFRGCRDPRRTHTGPPPCANVVMVLLRDGDGPDQAIFWFIDQCAGVPNEPRRPWRAAGQRLLIKRGSTNWARQEAQDVE